MDVEKAVLEYLYEFGNTRETDILQYIKNESGYSARGCKKLIGRLEKKKEIFRIVHVKLRPPAVYYSVAEYVPSEILKEMIKAEAQIQAAEYAALSGH